MTAPYPDTRYLATSDMVHIGYQTFGQGPYDLVFNDRWISNIDANWDVPGWGDFQRTLGRRARVIMFDRRGFGVSDRPTSTDSLALERSVDDLWAVLDAVDAGGVALLGVEDGAAVSLMFAASHPGPARVVRAAMGIIEAVRPLGLEIRAGVPTGEIQTIDGKVGGLGVVIGARVGAMAGPGDVLASSTVKDLTAGSGLVFEDAGEHELTGVPDRWHLFRVVQ